MASLFTSTSKGLCLSGSAPHLVQARPPSVVPQSSTAESPSGPTVSTSYSRLKRRELVSRGRWPLGVSTDSTGGGAGIVSGGGGCGGRYEGGGAIRSRAEGGCR